MYDVCDTAGEYFITMEYIDGENLASLTGRIGRLLEDFALRIARRLYPGSVNTAWTPGHNSCWPATPRKQ